MKKHDFDDIYFVIVNVIMWTALIIFFVESYLVFVKLGLI